MLKDKYIKKRLKQSKVFKPKETRIAFEVQGTFSYMTPYVNKVLRGFYESLAQAAFAGRLRNRHEEEYDIEPDLTNYTRQRYIEVKCCGLTRRIMLKNEQIEKYEKLQLKEFPIENPRIYFTMFRYGVRGIEKEVSGLSENEIIQYLAENTKYMIGLPFSVIKHIHENGPNISELYTRAETERSIPSVNFSTRAFELFFAEPEKALKDISLNPEDFNIKRLKTSKKISINSFRLKQFPLTLIKDIDKYHLNFVENLRIKREELSDLEKSDLNTQEVPF